ncbi:TIGR02587 family membrane protein [Ramlibacter henchirensis]|uniref:TIGR02587 family membrane protein n=1 Tax=Ramlibacter henchirensis TaxID=204072 RepID=A0A4Z0C3R3_9BURK|nr:TIGR02587 family membrane protein [Ramlibacter henchirensis]TFZ05861.1 TIGR02587 family membrane protein [Ramlibacter henchirensis]
MHPRLAAVDRRANLHFAHGLTRAFAGAVIFGIPLLMTMEMWWLGFHMSPVRLALLIALFFPFLVALSWHVGFEPTFSLKDDVLDALVAYLVGFVASLLVLWLLGALRPGEGLREVVGKVSLQAVPASIGALLSQSQLGHAEAGQQMRGGREDSYFSELFIMAVGGLFLAFNVAPTEEILMIALRLGGAQALLLALVTLAATHAFVYGAEFRGQPPDHQQAPWWSVFARFTVVGYALALLLSAFLLWTFGRLDGLALPVALSTVVVLAFPAAIGAAAARLIL